MIYKRNLNVADLSVSDKKKSYPNSRLARSTHQKTLSRSHDVTIKYVDDDVVWHITSSWLIWLVDVAHSQSIVCSSPRESNIHTCMICVRCFDCVLLCEGVHERVWCWIVLVSTARAYYSRAVQMGRESSNGYIASFEYMYRFGGIRMICIQTACRISNTIKGMLCSRWRSCSQRAERHRTHTQ